MSAKRKSIVLERRTASRLNPLIGVVGMHDTLENCADAVRSLGQIPSGSPGEAHYLFAAVEAALRYEAGAA